MAISYSANAYKLLGGFKKVSFVYWNIGNVSAEIVISRNLPDVKPQGADRLAKGLALPPNPC